MEVSMELTPKTIKLDGQSILAHRKGWKHAFKIYKASSFNADKQSKFKLKHSNSRKNYFPTCA